MRVAIPVVQGKLCMHFGHCEHFALIDVEDKEIKAKNMVTPPPHAPGVIPEFLHQQGANCIIAGGMGSRAQSLFAQHGIEVIVGAPAEDPEMVVKAYVDGSLQTGGNVCDH